MKLKYKFDSKWVNDRYEDFDGETFIKLQKFVWGEL